jgi:hypothetical protein
LNIGAPWRDIYLNSRNERLALYTSLLCALQYASQ